MIEFLDALLFRDGIVMGVLHWLIVVLLALLILVLVSLMLEGCKAVYVKFNTAEVVEEDIFVTVVEKDYNAGYTTFIKSGKVLTPIHHSASYDVCLKYGEEKFTIDDQELYDSVNKNDKIPAKLIRYLSKTGKVLDTDIKIEEDS